MVTRWADTIGAEWVASRGRLEVFTAADVFWVITRNDLPSCFFHTVVDLKRWSATQALEQQPLNSPIS